MGHAEGFVAVSFTSLLYRLARISADANAVERAVEAGSPKPLLRRLVNKGIGRGIVSKLWWR